MSITKHDNHNGTSTWTFTDGTIQLRCNDCDHWTYEGKQIAHSKRCDTPQAQQTAVPTSATTTQPRTANGLSSDEVLAAVQRGYLSQNAAMNRDF